MHSRSIPAALLVALCTLVLVACGRGNEIQQAPAETIYERGLRNLEGGNYRNAIAYFEHLEARFPFSNAARQAQIDLIYAYYRNGQKESAIDAADQFIREHPTHPRVDYALYMQGLIYFDRTPNRFDRLLRIDLDKRPPQDTMRSFSAFQQLAQRYPDSEYVPDARDRMIYLRNRLAAYEITVAEYYMRRGAYVAALNRSRYCIERYAGAPATEEALHIKMRAYERLGMRDMAANVRAVIDENFPRS